MKSFKASVIGPYHEKVGLPCQDAYAVAHKSGFSAGAVTDGLSSAIVNGEYTEKTHSDISSRIAAERAVAVCAENYYPGMPHKDIHRMLKKAFAEADAAVNAEAAKNGDHPALYDTTLCLAILTESGELYYGNAGDSGLVALTVDGRYLQITQKQNDEYGGVFPLCAGPRCWEFGCATTPISAVLLASDGVFDAVCPSLLKSQGDTGETVYIPLARLFLERTEEDEDEIKALEVSAEGFLKKQMGHVADDKTALVVYNPAKPATIRDDDYYKEPDWGALHERFLNGLSRSEEAEPPESKEEMSPQSVVDEAMDMLSDALPGQEFMEQVVQLLPEDSSEVVGCVKAAIHAGAKLLDNAVDKAVELGAELAEALKEE